MRQAGHSYAKPAVRMPSRRAGCRGLVVTVAVTVVVVTMVVMTVAAGMFGLAVDGERKVEYSRGRDNGANPDPEVHGETSLTEQA